MSVADTTTDTTTDLRAALLRVAADDDTDERVRAWLIALAAGDTDTTTRDSR